MRSVKDGHWRWSCKGGDRTRFVSSYSGHSVEYEVEENKTNSRETTHSIHIFTEQIFIKHIVKPGTRPVSGVMVDYGINAGPDSYSASLLACVLGVV